MADVKFSQAASAYQDAFRAAERIIKQAGGDDASSGTESTSAASGSSFLDMVGSALHNAEGLSYKSESVSNAALSGKANLTDVITAVASAENSLNTVVAIRDKVVNAYQQIIQMPI